MLTRHKKIVVERWSCKRNDSIALKDKAGLIELEETVINGFITKGEKRKRISSYKKTYNEITKSEMSVFLTQEHCFKLFAEVVSEVGLPVELAESLTSHYICAYKYGDRPVETKHVDCNETEIIYVINYYKITNFADFVRESLKGRFGTRDDMLFPHLRQKPFALPKGYIAKLKNLINYPNYQYQEKLKKIKSKKDIFIVRY